MSRVLSSHPCQSDWLPSQSTFLFPRALVNQALVQLKRAAARQLAYVTLRAEWMDARSGSGGVLLYRPVSRPVSEPTDALPTKRQEP